MQLLKIRYYQLRRDLSYWVFIIGLLVFFISKEISAVSLNYSFGLAGIIWLLLYNYHLNRKDLHFISKYLNQPKLQVCVNYNLLLLPVSAAMFYNHRWESAAGLHLLVSALGFLMVKISGPSWLFIGRIIPSAQFEWISGLRKNFYLLIPLLLLAVILSPVKLFGVAALFLLNSIFLGFYSFFEPRLMLNAEGLETGSFLDQKVYFFCRIILVTNVPLLLINSIVYPEVAFINLAFLTAFLLLASCMVFLKYSNYKPNETMPFNADLLILYGSIFIPYLLPLGIFLYFSNKKKAIHNLSYYLDDHR